MSRPTDPILRFAEFALDLTSGELRKAGELVRLPPQPSRALALLAGRAGEVVTREELRRELWGSDTHVDFEASLNFCIRQIRAALGDDPEAPRFLQTLPRRGYRFVCPVEARAVAPASPRLRPVVILATVVLLALVAQGPRPPATPRLTLVVRPFQSPGQVVLGAALTGELAFQLSQLPSRKWAVLGPGQVRAGYVLEGQVSEEARRLRIGVRLADLRGGAQVWSDVFWFDPDLTEGGPSTASRAAIFIARSVTQQLTRELEARRAASPSRSARDYYLEGRMLWREENPAFLGASVASFQRAIQEDPRYAQAYAGLADALNAQARLASEPAELFAQAKAAATHALELDPGLSEAHAALGFARLYHDWSWSDAERSLGEAVRRDPDLAQAHQWYASFLSAMGRHDEAIREALLAKELAPLSPGVSFELGRTYLFARQYRYAAGECQRTLELERRFYPADWCLQLSEKPPVVNAWASDRLGSRSLLFSPAELRSLRGDTAGAIEGLEAAYSQRACGLVFLRVNPSFDALHDDPRFRRLVARMRFPSGAREAPG